MTSCVLIIIIRVIERLIKFSIWLINATCIDALQNRCWNLTRNEDELGMNLVAITNFRGRKSALSLFCGNAN